MTLAAVFVPLVAGSALRLGDNVLREGSQFSRYGDDVVDVARLGRYGDEIGRVGRYSDELDDAGNLQRRLDNYVSPNGSEAHLGREALERQRLSQRLDDWVSPDGEVARLGNEAFERRRITQQFDDASLSTHSDDLYPSCGNSFTAGTLVETEDGAVPIEDIEVGDRVLGEDPETGEQGYYEVVALTNHPENELLEVTVETIDDLGEGEDGANISGEATQEVMEVTAEHPIYVEGKGWMLAENLESGDELRTADDKWSEVILVEQVQLDEPELVYNFTVKGTHTYFVLAIEVLVHNDRACKLYETKNLSDAFDKLVEIRETHIEAVEARGGTILFRGFNGVDPDSPIALRASAFRLVEDQLKTVDELAEVNAILKNYGSWDSAVAALGYKHASGKYFRSPFLSTSPLIKTARLYAWPQDLFSEGIGYFHVIDVKNSIRKPIRNPRALSIDQIEYLIPVGITDNDILGTVSFRKTRFESWKNHTKYFDQNYTKFGQPLRKSDLEDLLRRLENY